MSRNFWKNISFPEKPLRRADSHLITWNRQASLSLGGLACFFSGHLPVYDGTEYFRDGSYTKHYHCSNCKKEGVI